MAQIVVDLDGLEGVAVSLRRVGVRLDVASRCLEVAGADTVGHRGLRGSLADFGDSWRHGLHAIGGSVDLAGARLETALAAYRQLEHDLAEAAR